MNNAEWCTKQGIKYRRLAGCILDGAQFVSIGYYGNGHKYHELYRGKPVSALVTECIIAWLDMPHPEPILTAAEKSYLAAVIRPFRDRVRYIQKLPDRPYEFIVIKTKTKTAAVTELPIFNEGEMYKGMQLWKAYSLEELGL